MDSAVGAGLAAEEETVDLVQFLRDRLAETEAAVLRYRDGHEGPCINFKGQDPKHYSEYDSCALHLEAAEATPYRDATFGLAEVEAKREQLKLHSAEPGQHPDYCWYDKHQLPCPSLRLLALPYADHAGYDASWKL